MRLVPRIPEAAEIDAELKLVMSSASNIQQLIANLLMLMMPCPSLIEMALLSTIVMISILHLTNTNKTVAHKYIAVDFDDGAQLVQ